MVCAAIQQQKTAIAVVAATEPHAKAATTRRSSQAEDPATTPPATPLAATPATLPRRGNEGYPGPSACCLRRARCSPEVCCARPA